MLFDDELKIKAKANHVPISFDETMEFVVSLIDEFDCKEILEIGTAIGFGSISMASLTDCSHIDTVEIDKDCVLEAKSNIETRGLSDKITVHNADAKDYIDACNKKYDLIYLDGPKGQYINYLPRLKQLLKKDGLLIADNLFFHGMVTGTTVVPVSCRAMIKGLHKFIDEITLSSELSTQIYNIGDGVACVRLKN